jgi:DNA-binding Xre family transcriptional regulator
MLSRGDCGTMMRSHFEDLRRLKEFREKRDLPIRTISEETGLSQGAILRVKNLSLQRVYFSTLEALCSYFEVKTLSELIEYVPDRPDPAQEKP